MTNIATFLCCVHTLDGAITPVCVQDASGKRPPFTFMLHPGAELQPSYDGHFTSDEHVKLVDFLAEHIVLSFRPHRIHIKGRDYDALFIETVFDD